MTESLKGEAKGEIKMRKTRGSHLSLVLVCVGEACGKEAGVVEGDGLARVDVRVAGSVELGRRQGGPVE